VLRPPPSSVVFFVLEHERRNLWSLSTPLSATVFTVYSQKTDFADFPKNSCFPSRPWSGETAPLLCVPRSFSFFPLLSILPARQGSPLEERPDHGFPKIHGVFFLFLAVNAFCPTCSFLFGRSAERRRLCRIGTAGVFFFSLAGSFSAVFLK